MNSKFNDNILSQPTRFIIKFSLRNHDLYSSPQSPIVSNKLFDFLHTVSISLQSDLSIISGASMNPARSLAPALLSGSITDLWLYSSATFTGTMVIAFALRKKLIAKMKQEDNIKV